MPNNTSMTIVYETARVFAQQQRISLGKAVSTLIRKGFKGGNVHPENEEGISGFPCPGERATDYSGDSETLIRRHL
ncbi:hypothetical protein L0156_25195 [bacterium]|nr:hypothetical protein [bacterium]